MYNVNVVAVEVTTWFAKRVHTYCSLPKGLTIVFPTAYVRLSYQRLT